MARNKQPSLKARRISPHTLRHTTAMHLLQAGVDMTVIALWLGHESPATTHLYVEADLTLKERALSKLDEPTAKQIRYRPTDKLLRFLENL
jgi:site-specific recombinase XerD